MVNVDGTFEGLGICAMDVTCLEVAVHTSRQADCVGTLAVGPFKKSAVDVEFDIAGQKAWKA